MEFLYILKLFTQKIIKILYTVKFKDETIKTAIHMDLFVVGDVQTVIQGQVTSTLF